MSARRTSVAADEPPSVLERKYRRRSALQSFACPMYFKSAYVDGLGHDSQPSRRGTAFHLVARRYIELLIAHGCEDDLDLATRAFREGIAASMVSADIIQEVADLWWRFVPTFHLDVDTVLMHEERPDDAYDWQPDLVRVYGDVLEITDFKTHWAILNQDAAETAFQVLMYSARARRVWPGFGTYRFSLWFVRWGAIIHVESSQADIDRHEEHLRLLEAGIATALATDTWPAVPGDTCQYCTLRCPIADNARLLPVRITSREDAERTLGEYLTLERAVKARRDALEAYAAYAAPIRVQGLEFGAKPTSRAAFPIAPVLEVFRAHGLPATFTVSKTALKPWLEQRRYQHIAPALQQLAVTKSGTEYRVRKVGDIGPTSFEEDTAQ